MRKAMHAGAASAQGNAYAPVLIPGAEAGMADSWCFV
jgi:hypothetical protein